MKAPIAARMPGSRVWRELYALYLAVRHPGTPWYVKVLPAFALLYGISPVDLIPDAVPVLGAVDDVVMLPTLILLAMRLVPDAVRQDCLARADGASVTTARATRTAGIIGVFVALAVIAVIVAVVARVVLN